MPNRKIKKPARKGISLTEQAIRQIELMLIAEYRLHRKRLPAGRKLRNIAEDHHKKYFG